MEQEYHVRCQECNGMFFTVDKREAELGICKGCRDYLGISPEEEIDEFENADLEVKEMKLHA